MSSCCMEHHLRVIRERSLKQENCELKIILIWSEKQRSRGSFCLTRKVRHKRSSVGKRSESSASDLKNSNELIARSRFHVSVKKEHPS